MTIETAKALAETIALIGAAGFFAYKIFAGYLYVSLAVFVRSERRHLDEERDAIVVIIRLKKTGTGMIRLHDAQVLFLPVGGSSTALPLIGLQRRGQKAETIGSRLSDWQGTVPIQRKIVDWDSSHESEARLQLAPGDETQFACHHVIPRAAVCAIELTILGQGRTWPNVGEWKASHVSLPVLHPNA
jgi:hypothetical protein